MMYQMYDVIEWAKAAPDGLLAGVDRARDWCVAARHAEEYGGALYRAWHALDGALYGFREGYKAARHDAYMEIGGMTWDLYRRVRDALGSA